MQPSGTKELCDALYHNSPPGITESDYEEHLTLLNEYLVKVAAPGHLPAGGEVLLFDMAGFKLSFLMGESYNMFQASGRRVALQTYILCSLSVQFETPDAGFTTCKIKEHWYFELCWRQCAASCLTVPFALYP